MERVASRKKSNIQKTWIISYILVLAIPVFTWMATFSISKSIIQKQTDEININMLTLLGEAVDQILDTTSFDMRRIATDGNVIKLVSNGRIQDSFDVYRAMQVKDLFARFVNYNASIKDIYLYLYDENLIISQNTVADAELFHGIYVSALLGMKPTEWIAMLRRTYIMEYYCIENENSQYVICLMTFPVSMPDRARATLVIQFNADTFKSLINQLSSNDIIVSALGQGDILMASNLELAQKDIDRSDYIEAKIVSDTSGWTYVSLIPRGIYTKEYYKLQSFTFLALVLVIICGLSLIVYFTRQYYTPINNLVKQLETSYQARKTDQNEYTFLRESIESVVDSHKKQNEKLTNFYIQRLLTGRANLGVPAEEYMSLLDLDYNSGSYAVLLFDFDDEGQLLTTMTSTVSMLVTQSPLYGHGIEIDGRIAFLLDCCDLNDDVFPKVTMELATQLQKHFGTLMMTASAIHNSVYEISQAYDEALYCMEYLFSLGGGTYMFYQHMKEYKANTSFYYPPEEERRVIEYIAKGDVSQARGLLNRIWEQNLNQKGFRLPMARLLMWNFICSLYKAAVERFDNFENIEITLNPSKISSLEDMHFELENLLDKLQNDITVSNRYVNDQIGSQVLEYIKKNYIDINLSVEKICEDFSRSRSSLFTIMKETTGEGLLYHINKTRVEAAKKLLISKSMDLNDMATTVGYANVQTFMRVFKKYEGITPGRYREIVQAQNTLNKPNLL